MATFILTWNPTLWDYEANGYQEGIDATSRGEPVADRWSIGRRRKGLAPGDRAFLLRQGPAGRGLVGAGRFSSGPEVGEHWDGTGGEAIFADVKFDVLLDVEERLETEDLLLQVPGVRWNSLYSSGIEVEASAAVTLESAWGHHVAELGFGLADELPTGQSYPEGAVERVLVNRYERNGKARQACIDRWGHACVVCQFNFQDVYGELGQDYIHVHHLVDLSTVGADYQVDPVVDLKPVCPNCHAMLHRQRPALSPDELRQRLIQPD